MVLGFPGGSVVNNPPANAEDMRSIPNPGGSHRPRGANKPVCHNYCSLHTLEPVLQSKRSHCNETLTHSNTGHNRST